MKQRIITALIIAILTIAGMFLLPLNYFMLFSAVVFLLASHEWRAFVSPKKPKSVLYLFALALAVSMLLLPLDQLWINGVANPLLLGFLSMAIVWWCLSFLLVISYPRSAVIWKRRQIIKGVLGVCTLLPFFWGMLFLRSVNIEHDFYFGAQLLMFVFALVWAADTGAYFCGKSFGKHRLAANVSPGKTVEGFVGGLVSAMLVALAATLFFVIPAEKKVIFFIASFVTTLVSALGDLNESIFKREAGLKDSGTILPGHGGILDRIDSLTAAVPVFAIIYLVWLN